ncbi:MAG TPA: CHASE domain-containing protein, partial [Devosia sp.]|nr:CHASE domain-containing protein [Devosia sp.]
MKDGRRSWLRPTLIPALIALVVIVAAAFYADQQNTILTTERMHSAVLDRVALIRAKLEGNINGNIQLVRGMVSTLSTEPNMNQERFAALAVNLFGQGSQLRSIAAAPDLVVRLTYPLQGNSAAIGLDYRTNLAQRDATLRARDTGRLVLAGPVNLVQGGRGFIGRFPVYVGSGADRAFWGIISAVVDVDKLYADSGLLDPDLSIDVSISGRDNGRFFGPDLSAD